MPSGKTHDRITLWLLLPVAIICYIVTSHGESTLLFVAGFFFSGLMFGPDLDIHSIQYKRWGIFRDFWLPYQKLLHHRSFFSHGFLVGTIVRLIYLSCGLFLLAAFLIAILQLLTGLDWNWQTFFKSNFSLVRKQYLQEAIALFVGLELGAMSHYLSDWIGSAYKKRKKIAKNKPKPKIKRKK